MARAFNSAEFVHVGDKLHLSIDGKLQRCVVCGHPIEYSDKKRADHHCPLATEAAKQEANSRDV